MVDTHEAIDQTLSPLLNVDIKMQMPPWLCFPQNSKSRQYGLHFNSAFRYHENTQNWPNLYHTQNPRASGKSAISIVVIFYFFSFILYDQWASTISKFYWFFSKYRLFFISFFISLVQSLNSSHLIIVAASLPVTLLILSVKPHLFHSIYCSFIIHCIH